eukprot:2936211-Amphidinium_carterae.1
MGRGLAEGTCLGIDRLMCSEFVALLCLHPTSTTCMMSRHALKDNDTSANKASFKSESGHAPQHC